MLMTRAQFSDSQLETQLPALRAVTFNEFEQYEDEYVHFFNVEDSDRAIEQFSGVSGLGPMVRMKEGDRITYDSIVQAYDKTFKHIDYALGYRVTHQLKRDDKFRLVKSMAMALGRSSKFTIETEAASDFNNGFSGSYNGPDGVPLFSASHPRAKAGGVQANTPPVAVDLDIPSLEAALTAYRGFTDHAGLLQKVLPKLLVVAPANEFTAAEILSGPNRADTANNTPNAFQHRDGTGSFTKYRVWNFLTDPDAWFIVGETKRLGLRFFWREKFDTASDYDFDTNGMKTRGWMCFSHGWSDWMGLWGSAGA